MDIYTCMPALLSSPYCAKKQRRTALRGNPCLSKSRRHLSTYIHYLEKTGRGGTSIRVIVNFEKGYQMRSFFSNERSKWPLVLS